ncbi:MAG: hypothetical protein EZS28_025926 [Streblomastix strix]|uniref:Uncharacterized protein n=1 Tax=Streblomastix strix TaxID=222440 RepID=A0A5J4V6X2_9EUKA|nr:MAG: hypothetical protein EZS28_025926 [Streblomastix strix]
MIYYSWKGNDETICGAKVLNVANMIVANCTTAILLMKILPKETYDTPIWEQYSEIQQSKKNKHTLQVSNQFYSDRKIVYDEANKHGLIYMESLNKGDSQGISPVHIEVSGIFVIRCHSAVGSGISITKLLMELTDSVFIEPSCYSNMIYLNRTLGTIEDCVFSGRNSTYQYFNQLKVFEQLIQEYKDICPNNAQYYSSTSYGVLYINEGEQSINSVILNQTKVGGVRVDKGTALLNEISFIEAEIQEGGYYDGSLLLVQCTGNSNVDINELIVNRKREDDQMPNTSLNTANIECQCLRYRRTIEVCDFRRQDDSKIIFGDYLRGDYDDDNYPEIELQGYQQYLRRYWTPPILLQITIADGVIEGYNKLWYYQYRDSQLQGRDIYGCGWCDDACRTFEFCLQEVSLGIGGNETTLIENKTIMISDDANGYDQVKTIELNQQDSRCQNLRIMKVLFGDSHAMTQQADIQIFKDGVITLEDNNKA